jgi:hypothetical protein
MFMHLARQAGFTGGSEDTLESASSLGDFYQRLRTGGANLTHGEVKWSFGLALVKAVAT